MKLGSLFDGIGGFPLAGTYWGIHPVWASEIEPFPIQVTTQRFPNMKHLGSVCDIHGDKVEPVDVITFGSPCQDLSVAGKRQGLDGARSGLFYEAVRIIEEMRRATDGVYPRFAVWENVPGALSSNEGHDFRAVLEALSAEGEVTIPMPKSGKWSGAGMVRGATRSLAWRILDAQHFGVPQRRRRIFLVVDFRGQRAGEVLFEPEGMRGHTAESKKAREEVAVCTGRGTKFGVDTSTRCFRKLRHDLYIPDVKASTVKTRDFKDATDIVLHPNVVGPLLASAAGTARSGGNHNESDMVLAFMAGQSAQARSLGLAKNISPTLKGESGGNTVPAIAFNARQDPTSGTVSGALDSQPNTHAIAIQHSMIGRNDDAGPGGPGFRSDDQMWTLDGRGAAHAIAVDVRNLRLNEDGNSGTLQAKATGGYSLNYTNPVMTPYTVRRLTPKECERLQGYPDGWTDVEGASDTKRYKALGNSVAVPCVAWVLGRINMAYYL